MGTSVCIMGSIWELRKLASNAQRALSSDFHITSVINHYPHIPQISSSSHAILAGGSSDQSICAFGSGITPTPYDVDATALKF